MSDTVSKAQRDAAGKRRQQYWKNRRAVEKIAGSLQILPRGQMTPQQLTIQLHQDLLMLEDHLRSGSSPKLYGASVRALEAFEEIMLRGEQLSLL